MRAKLMLTKCYNEERLEAQGQCCVYFYITLAWALTVFFCIMLGWAPTTVSLYIFEGIPISFYIILWWASVVFLCIILESKQSLIVTSL